MTERFEQAEQDKEEEEEEDKKVNKNYSINETEKLQRKMSN